MRIRGINVGACGSSGVAHVPCGTSLLLESCFVDHLCPKDRMPLCSSHCPLGRSGTTRCAWHRLTGIESSMGCRQGSALEHYGPWVDRTCREQSAMPNARCPAHGSAGSMTSMPRNGPHILHRFMGAWPSHPLTVERNVHAYKRSSIFSPAPWALPARGRHRGIWMGRCNAFVAAQGPGKHLTGFAASAVSREQGS
jgi:hypothetical protein